MNSRPNLVFIQNDHQALHQWQDYAVKPARPTFERLARQGAEFENTYCTTPLCAPTRYSLLTGLYPHTHKNYFNTSEVRFDRETYLDILADAGYENWYFGKWHAGPGTAGEHNCMGISYPGYNSPYTHQDYADYLAQNGLPDPTVHIRHVLGWPEWGYGKPNGLNPALYEGNEAFPLRQSSYCGQHAVGILNTPKETHEAFYLANRACEAVRVLAARPEGAAPFSLRVDFWGPHQPYFPTQEYLDMYKTVDYPPYPSWNSDLSGKPLCYHRERNLPMGKDGQLIMPNAVPWAYYNELMRYCAAQITLLDHAAGVVLDALETYGLMENTLVIYTADHGDALACHGGHFDKASYMPQELLHIPMAMRWDGVIPPGQKVTAPVCSVSVPTTLLDAADLSFPYRAHGQSLLALAREPKADWPDYVVSETHGHGFGEEVASRAIIRGRWKYVAYFDTENIDELYDLEQDKYELSNLAEDPLFADIKDSLQRQLLAWQAETGDELVFTWAHQKMVPCKGTAQ